MKHISENLAEYTGQTYKTPLQQVEEELAKKKDIKTTAEIGDQVVFRNTNLSLLQIVGTIITKNETEVQVKTFLKFHGCDVFTLPITGLKIYEYKSKNSNQN